MHIIVYISNHFGQIEKKKDILRECSAEGNDCQAVGLKRRMVGLPIPEVTVAEDEFL